jgi:hypothetical protein
VSRVVTLLLAVLFAAAAPAKAWCEASCLAPVHSTTDPGQTHCPLHETPQGPSFSASGGNCPVLDSARPVVGKVDVAVPVIGQLVVAPALIDRAPSASRRAGNHAPRPLKIPLRI